MATISISQLDTATQASVDDLYEVAVVDATSQTGYASRKLTSAQIATLIAQGVQFSGLSTEAKTIIAAINEAAQNGGTEVEANPTGTPTDTLETIDINGTVYEVGGGEPVSKTVTGNPINITDAADAPIVSGTVEFEPIQDLHGYDHPWAGGNGKNLLPMMMSNIKTYNGGGTWNGNVYTYNGVTYTVLTDSDGNITGINCNGTASRATEFYVYTNQSNSCPYNGMLLNGCTNGSDSTYDLRISDITTTSTKQTTGSGEIIDVTSTGQWRCSIMIRQGYTASNLIFYPMIRLVTETDATFEPYSNICPITGYDDCEVEVTDDTTSPTVTQTYTIDLDGTRYGGKVYPVTGKLTDSMGHIASYAGETIGEPWLSDRDEYVAGTTPTTGAEVVYTLATPLEVQLSPQQIRTLEGTNNITTNMTGMTLEYITQDYQPLVKLIERSAGHHYSTQERVVGTWIDGKPLYEKSYDTGQLPNNTYKQTLHGISNLKHIVHFSGWCENSTGIKSPLPIVSQSSPVLLFVDGENIVIQSTSDRSAYTVSYVTLQYTKTTD